MKSFHTVKPRAAMFRTHARGSSFGVERMQNPHKAKEETYGYMRAGSMSVRVPKHKEKIKAPLLWCFLVFGDSYGNRTHVFSVRG